MPVYINGAWITSNGDDNHNSNHAVRLTVTKQTSPPITLISEFTINVRSTSNFVASVAAQSGINAGQPTQVVNYTLRNNYPVPITPVADASNWQEIDYYPLGVSFGSALCGSVHFSMDTTKHGEDVNDTNAYIFVFQNPCVCLFVCYISSIDSKTAGRH